MSYAIGVAEALDKVRLIVDEIQAKTTQHHLYVNNQLAAILRAMTQLQNGPITQNITQKQQRPNVTDEMDIDHEVPIKQEHLEEDDGLSSPLARRSGVGRDLNESFTSATIESSPRTFTSRLQELRGHGGHTNIPPSSDIPYAGDEDEEEDEEAPAKGENRDNDDELLGTGYTPPPPRRTNTPRQSGNGIAFSSP